MMRKYILFFLLLFSLGSFIFGEGMVISSLPEGVYSSDQIVRLESSLQEGDLEYRFEESVKSTSLSYSLPLFLSALPGEEKTFTIHTYIRKNTAEAEEDKTFVYTIDKKPPRAPEIYPGTGVYSSDTEVSFRADADSEIMYSINSPVGKDGRVYKGKPLLLGKSDEIKKEYTIYAYSRDKAGNISPVIQSVIGFADISQEQEESLKVISPVPGNFSNPQYLLIENLNFEWIRYSLDGTDPSYSGMEYTGPVEIDKRGPVTVRISGKPADSKKIFTHKVSYTVTPVSNIKSNSENGIFDKTVILNLESDSPIYMNFADRTPTKEDALYESSLILSPVPGMRKITILRFLSYSEITSRTNEHRYVYILDDRTPYKPIISVDGKNSNEQPPQITLTGPPGAEIRYTLDGSEPDPKSALYTAPFSLGDHSSVQAKSFYPNGRQSGVSAEYFTFSSEKASPPTVQVLSESEISTEIILSINHPRDTKLVYELSYDGKEPPQPSGKSSVCPDLLTCRVPYGMEQTYWFKFAYLDSKGMLSEATEMRTTLDRCPPAAPKVGYDLGILKIAGEGNIYYTITDDNSIPPLPDKNDTRYTRPVYLLGEKDSLTTYTVYAVAIDDRGNVSSTTGPVFFHFDRRIPRVPEIASIDDGDIINSGQVEITFLEKEPNVDIYYTFSIDGSEPPVPSKDSELFNEKLLFTAMDN